MADGITFEAEQHEIDNVFRMIAKKVIRNAR